MIRPTSTTGAPVSGVWTCKACTLTNDPTATVCLACDTPALDGGSGDGAVLGSVGDVQRLGQLRRQQLNNERQEIMQALGPDSCKPCPACGFLIMKADGDDTMMCGCEARPAGGTTEKALKAGGCGHEFNFRTLKPLGHGEPGKPANDRQVHYSLPAGWRSQVSPAGRTFYICDAQRLTQWEVPTEPAVIEGAEMDKPRQHQRLPQPTRPAPEPPTSEAMAGTTKTLDHCPQKESCSVAGQEDEDEDSVCVVCWVCPRTHACIPCGHKCVCAGCAQSIEDTKACPLCRTNIQGMSDWSGN